MKKLYIIILLVFIYTFLSINTNNMISRERLEGDWNVIIMDVEYYLEYGDSLVIDGETVEVVMWIEREMVKGIATGERLGTIEIFPTRKKR